MLSDSFLVFFDNGFYHFYFCWLKAMIIYKFHWKQIELCFCSTFHHMYMNRRVVIGVKQESITKKRKYCWHVFRIMSQR